MNQLLDLLYIKGTVQIKEVFFKTLENKITGTKQIDMSNKLMNVMFSPTKDTTTMFHIQGRINLGGLYIPTTKNRITRQLTMDKDTLTELFAV